MEFGGGNPKYHMTCLPAPNEMKESDRDAGRRRALQEHSVQQMGPIAIHRCNAPEMRVELLWTKVPAHDGEKIRLQLQPKVTGPDSSPPQLCLTAVATTGWCINRAVCNDELDALPCNSSDAAQLWWWNGTQIVAAMPETLKVQLWNGRPGRCNGWPCCIDVNAHKALNGQVLDGNECPGAQWKAVASGASIAIQSLTEPGFCIGYQAKMPHHGPVPPPSPPPGPPPRLLPGQEWREPNAYFVNQSLQSANLRSADNQCVYSPGWSGSFVMDPLDPKYLSLLLKEAHRHVALLGDDFAGVSCDRGESRNACCAYSRINRGLLQSTSEAPITRQCSY
jgi:hypothetical protein